MQIPTSELNINQRQRSSPFGRGFSPMTENHLLAAILVSPSLLFHIIHHLFVTFTSGFHGHRLPTSAARICYLKLFSCLLVSFSFPVIKPIRPNFSYFRDKESAKVLSDKDFKNANVKLPAIEHLSYENGRLRGKDEGWSDGFDDGKKEGHEQAREEFEITYPCSVCGKQMNMKPGGKDHMAMIGYMKEHGWHHGDCGK